MQLMREILAAVTLNFPTAGRIEVYLSIYLFNLHLVRLPDDLQHFSQAHIGSCSAQSSAEGWVAYCAIYFCQIVLIVMFMDSMR